MAELTITDDELVVELSLAERLGAMHRSLRIPLDAITAVQRVDHARHEVRGFRAPGTGAPGLVALGTWRRRGTKTFAAAYRDHPGYIIDLDGQTFSRLIVSFDPVPELEDVVRATG